MEKKIRKGIAAIAVFVLVLLAAGCMHRDPIPDTIVTKRVTILHTNDHHGRFWKSKHDEYGMATRKSLIDTIRKEVYEKGGTVVLLSAGDINTGVPESDLLDAEPDFQAMNEMGYTAMAVGNHEFDNSPDVQAKQRAWANFPFLAANIYHKESDERVYEPYRIIEENGTTIAVIGFTTADTKKVGNPKNISHLKFRDPIKDAQVLVSDIKKRYRPDLVIGLTHMGHYEDGDHGMNAPGDVTLARSLERGALDIIVGGHTHDAVCMASPNVVDKSFGPGDECEPDIQNGVVIVQAKEWGKYLGRADFRIDSGGAELTRYQLIPVNVRTKSPGEAKVRMHPDPPIQPDGTLERLLARFQDQGGDELNKQVGMVSGRFEGDREVIRFKQTNLGRLIASVQQKRVRADCGVMNSGGIRSSLEPGPVTYKDILMVQPYGNTLTYTDMSGRELLAYLTEVASKPVDTGGYAQLSGVSIALQEGRRYDIAINGDPVDPEHTYRISVPSYNAQGGDGYPRLVDHPGFVDTGFVDAEILKEYMETNSPLNPKDYASTE